MTNVNLHSSEHFLLSLTGESVNDWNCLKESINERSLIKVETMPPAVCPKRCSEYKDCHSCLTSTGAEGGWHECHWSVQLSEVMFFVRVGVGTIL